MTREESSRRSLISRPEVQRTGRVSWIPDKTDEPVNLQLSPGHSCPYKTGHPFLTISTNGMQDLAPANTDQSEQSSSWMTADGTLIVFPLPRTSSNQFSTDQITLFLNFGHATSCYKGAPQKCFKIIKNSSKSPIFKEIFHVDHIVSPATGALIIMKYQKRHEFGWKMRQDWSVKNLSWQ